MFDCDDRTILFLPDRGILNIRFCWEVDMLYTDQNSVSLLFCLFCQFQELLQHELMYSIL